MKVKSAENMMHIVAQSIGIGTECHCAVAVSYEKLKDKSK